MKGHLPYNIVLGMTLLFLGITVFYHFSIRESYATTIRYAYPVIEEPASSAPSPAVIVETDDAQEVPEEEPTAEEPASQSPPQIHFPLDLNTASAEVLKYIPQVGDVMSQRIIQYREVLGGYTDLEQLREIKGIGDSTYQKIYPYLYIEDGSGQYADYVEDAGSEDGDEEDAADGEEEPEVDEEYSEEPVDDWDG